MYYPQQNGFQQPYMQQQNRFVGYPSSYFNIANQIMMDKVQGIEGAKHYPMAANSSILLFDETNEGVVYIKMSNAIGECSSLRTFIEPAPQAQSAAEIQSVDMSNYVSRDEFNELKALVERSISNGKQSVSANNEQSAVSAVSTTATAHD